MSAYYAEVYSLTFPTATGVGRADIHGFSSPDGPLVLATQPPMIEYQGPSVFQEVQALAEVLVERYGPEVIIILHFNAASHGLELHEPTFNRISLCVEAGRVLIDAAPPIDALEVADLAGLTLAELRVLG